MECLKDMLLGLGGGFCVGAIWRCVSHVTRSGCLGALIVIAFLSSLLGCHFYFLPNSMSLRGFIGGFVLGYLIILRLIIRD